MMQENAHQATREPLEFIIHVFSLADVITVILLRMPYTHDVNMHLNNWIVLRNSRNIILEQIQSNTRKIQSPKPPEEVVRCSFGRTENV